MRPGAAPFAWVGLALLAALPARAEGPPPGYSGAQYVDAEGCVFARKDDGWQPRRNRDGSPVCGYPPSVAEAAPAAESPAEPVIVTVEERPAPAPETPTAAAPEQPAPPLATPPLATADAPSCALIGLGPDGHIAAGQPLGYPGTAPARACVAPDPAGFAAREAAPPRVAKPKVSKPKAPKPKVARAPHIAPGHRFVQVGAYGVPANGARALSRILGMGLPAARGKGRIGGKPVEVIYAGPFDDPAALRAALTRLRAVGYPDAMTR